MGVLTWGERDTPGETHLGRQTWGDTPGEEKLFLQSAAGTGESTIMSSSGGEENSWLNEAEVSDDDDYKDDDDGHRDKRIHHCLHTAADACNCQCHQEIDCDEVEVDYEIEVDYDEVEVQHWCYDNHRAKPTDKELINLLTRR